MDPCKSLASACPSVLLQALRGPTRNKILEAAREVTKNLDKPLCKMAFLKLLAVLSKTRDEELEGIVLERYLLPPPPECLEVVWDNEETLCSTLDGYVGEWLSASLEKALLESVVERALNELLMLIKRDDLEGKIKGLRLGKVLLEWNETAQEYVNGMEQCKAPPELQEVVKGVMEFRDDFVKGVFSKLIRNPYDLHNMITSIESEVVNKVAQSKDLIVDLERAALSGQVSEVIRMLKELQRAVEEVKGLSSATGEALQASAVEAAKAAVPPSPPKEGKCVSLHEALTLKGLVLPQMKRVIEGKIRLGGEDFGGKAEPFRVTGPLDIKGYISLNKSLLRRKTKVFVGAIALHSSINTLGKDCNCFGLGDLREVLFNVPGGDYVAVAIITPNEICDELKEFFEKGYGINNMGIVVYNPIEDEAASSGEIGKELELEARRLFGEEALVKHVLKRLCERFADSRVTRDLIASYFNIGEKEAEEVLKRLAKYLGRELKGGLYVSKGDCERS